MMAKVLGVPLLVLFVISAVTVPLTYISFTVWEGNSQPDFYFGVSYGGNTTAGAKLLIDKVQNYTNLFVEDSYPISTNETALNEVCSYAISKGLSIIVYFSFISHRINPWQNGWVQTARQTWGDRLLGIYIYDEPGGKQIDLGAWNNETGTFANVTTYEQAAQTYVNSLITSSSMNDTRGNHLNAFTSDYALYWYDYQAGYDGVFVELGWNNSRTQQIALCRGAAETAGKPWGAIITWTYTKPPFIASGPQIYSDMVTAYDAGAKYVIVFDYPNNPEDNPYGILQDPQFSAMEQFWALTQSLPKARGSIAAQVALVLPEDYGGGLRWESDNVWAPMNVTWRTMLPPDTQSSMVWENLNILSNRYGLRLNVIFEGDIRVNTILRYSKMYMWNQTMS